MSKSKWSIFTALCAIALGTMWAVPASAQTEPVKPKPPMYGYIANWQIPRAHWAEMNSSEANVDPILTKAMADGTIVAYGTDQNLVHTPDGWTQDDWFSSMSMGDLMKVLTQFYAESNPPQVLQTATKHWDLLLVTRYYNWKPGTSYKNGYVSVSTFRLKANAPDDAFKVISGEIVAPLLEQLLADGTILEYEIDTEYIHTNAPGLFSIVTVVQDPANLDKVDAAIQADIKAHPITGVTFDSLVKESSSRDELTLGNGTFK